MDSNFNAIPCLTNKPLCPNLFWWRFNHFFCFFFFIWFSWHMTDCNNFYFSSFIRLFRKGGGLHLQHLDVSGCKNITDKTLFKLSSSLGKLPADSGISDIEDSSCDCHTSCSCGKLSSTTPKTVKRGLVYLGLSGCYQITDAGLRWRTDKLRT